MNHISMHSYIPENISVDQGLELFIRQCKVRNLSPATIRDYGCAFRRFREYYDGLVSDITTDTVMGFIEHLQNSGVNPVTINTYCRHLKAIVRYWVSEGHMKPVKFVFQAVQETVKEVYTDREISLLLKKPDVKKCTFQELRTWAIINFFVGTGCRVGTLTQIKICDVDFENEMVNYGHTKNRRALYVPLSKQLCDVLHLYLRYRGGKPEDLLFPSTENTKLLETSVTRAIKAYCAKRGVREGNCHLFRHTFVKNWILSGGDPLRLQKILGHQCIDMVQHYANLYGTDLKVGFEDFNLLSKLSNDRIDIKKK